MFVLACREGRVPYLLFFSSIHRHVANFGIQSGNEHEILKFFLRRKPHLEATEEFIWKVSIPEIHSMLLPAQNCFSPFVQHG